MTAAKTPPAAPRKPAATRKPATTSVAEKAAYTSADHQLDANERVRLAADASRDEDA